MNRKVFLSHTSLIARYPEGNTFLSAAVSGAKDAGWEYEEMQQFSSSPRTPAEECRRRVSSCNAFVGILGLDWGSEVPGRLDTSYTKYEYDLAKQLMRPSTLLIMIDETTKAFPASEIAAISRDDLEKQKSFRRQHGLHATQVATPEALRREIADALRLLVHCSEPISEMIDRYKDFIEVKDFVTAWRYFRDRLNYRLDFELSWHGEHLRLLQKLFPHGVAAPPALNDVNDVAGALNALARAYKNIGQPGRAAEIFDRELDLQEKGTLDRVKGLANLVNTHRLTGHLAEAKDAARQMLVEVSKLNDPKWEAYGLYWNGVLCAGCGAVDEAVLLLRQAQVIFEQLHDNEASCAGLGRTYAHLAQLELWLGNPRGALCFGQHAHRYAERHNESREPIFASRITGTAKLRLGMYEESRGDLERALGCARDCAYWEEQLAATIALAELASWRPDSTSTGTLDLLNEELKDKALSGPYLMLLADFDNCLSQILQKLGRREKAISVARAALKASLSGRPDTNYHWGVIQARRQLLELGEQQVADVTKQAEQLVGSLGELVQLDEQQRKRAKLRAQFTELFRMVTGSYRYAPSKFVKLLREDWNAIRSVVEGRETAVPPQFLEIHLGHPCNLNCLYCRGGLRDKPEKQEFLQTAQAITLIHDIHAENPRAFVRLSGLIGEPLLHKNIVEILELMGTKSELRWALTTNGVSMRGERLLNALMKAQHVHISVDAGSNETYFALKGGERRDYERVIENIRELANIRRHFGSSTKIVVSFLLQEENYRELPELANELKTIKVDTLEIKMQHFDTRRQMTESQVREAYHLIDQVRESLSSDVFHIIVVQPIRQALDKIRVARPIDFDRCYANLLGLSPTVDPNGNVQMCCQYYQDTLGTIGNLRQSTMQQLWGGKERNDALGVSPRSICTNCSPSDEFINHFVQFLSDAQLQDSTFMDWVEREVQPVTEGEVYD